MTQPDYRILTTSSENELPILGITATATTSSVPYNAAAQQKFRLERKTNRLARTWQSISAGAISR
ncbi:MAG TPA: hypothetical protein VF511_04735 [Chthoniobacterales bacterium]|jgi:hypothetical protein